MKKLRLERELGILIESKDNPVKINDLYEALGYASSDLCERPDTFRFLFGLKGKSVYGNLKQVLNDRYDDISIVKTLSSLITHALIELEGISKADAKRLYENLHIVDMIAKTDCFTSGRILGTDLKRIP